MTEEYFKGKKVKNQYGDILTVLFITENSVQVSEDNIFYHTTKLYYYGKSLYTLLNSEA